MAAIMALIFVPALFVVGIMIMTNVGSSVAAILATLLFSVLAFGVFGGLMKLARKWENEAL
jgi:hypothetical protein